MKVMICGDPKWDDWGGVCFIMSQLDKDIISSVIIGRYGNFERFVFDEARRLGLEISLYDDVKWTHYKRGSHKHRNEAMIKKESPDFVLIFHDNMWQSDLFERLAKFAIKQGASVVNIRHHPETNEIVQVFQSRLSR